MRIWGPNFPLFTLVFGGKVSNTGALVFYTYYETNELGTLVITEKSSNSDSPIERMTVSEATFVQPQPVVIIEAPKALENVEKTEINNSSSNQSDDSMWQAVTDSMDMFMR